MIKLGQQSMNHLAHAALLLTLLKVQPTQHMPSLPHQYLLAAFCQQRFESNHSLRQVCFPYHCRT